MSTNYAVIQIAGKQLKVAEGDSFEVNQMEAYNPVVLAYSNEGNLQLGAPALEGVSVILAPQGESKHKTTVFRYKSKSRYRKAKGHKQPLVTLKVESISTGTKSKKSEETSKSIEKAQTTATTEKTEKAAKTQKTAKPKTSTKKEEKAEKATK